MAAKKVSFGAAGHRDPHSKIFLTKIIFLLLYKPFASEYKEFLVDEAIKAYTIHRYDFPNNDVTDPGIIIDMETIRHAKIKLGVDPRGGTPLHLANVSSVLNQSERI